MKKICVMLIALSLVLSVLSGCGKTDTVEASLNDIVLALGETRALPSKIMIGEEEKTLTYQFEGSSISIENYVLVARVENTETTVTASADGFVGTFKVQVLASDPAGGEEPTLNYRHVVVIGVDGAGRFFREADTPNIDAIFANGAITYSCLTAKPTSSAQCWGSLLHGVLASVHQLNNTIAESTPYPVDSPYPSFFRVIGENDADATLASFSHWAPLNTGIIENDINVHKVQGIPDADLTDAIVAYLGENKPTAMFVQFDEVDAAGHSTGYGTDTQLSKITEIDGYIGRIYEAYRESGMLEETLFIVTADHGGSGKSHGGLSDDEKYVMFAATGKTVQKGKIADMEIRDTAAIVLHALGYENPETWTARVPSGLFEGVVAGERPVYVNKDSDRYHESEPTPEEGSDRYITNYVKEHALNAYLTFDGDVADACNGNVTHTGTISFVDGYFGQGVALNNGFVTLNDYAVGTDSFTVALWIKADTVTSDPCIFANKDWQTGRNQGYALAIRNDVVRWNFGDGKNRLDCDVQTPKDYADGWMHIIASVDRESNQLRLCIDFQTVVSVDIPTGMQGMSFDTPFNGLHIGQDATGAYATALPAVIDELMIFDGALDTDDVQALAAYFGRPNP